MTKRKKVTKHLLVNLLQYMRPAYSTTELLFNERYLEPVFGKPDEHGNYTLVLGDRPNICFTAHTDTVHKQEGIQTLKIEDDIVTSITGSCLGADCTTGLWLMLGMIDAGVEGVYVAHAAEEIGGIGSAALVKDRPAWLIEVDAVISFDRFGTTSIITHQGGQRTASDEFALSLASILDINLSTDQYGTYTDSLEYAGVIPECTNISVGYFDQHTTRESQDLHFAEVLLERLIEADWSALAIFRNPDVYEPFSLSYDAYVDSQEEAEELRSLEKLVLDRPTEVAKLLHEYGITLDVICDELGLDYADKSWYTDHNNYYQS